MLGSIELTAASAICGRRVAAHINDNRTCKNQNVILAGSNLRAIMSLDTGLDYGLRSAPTIATEITHFSEDRLCQA